MAKGFYNFLSIKKDAPKTSLDQLDDVEKFVNKNVKFSGWLGIRVYEPERQNDEVFWHLGRNAPAKIKNILTIGVFNGHALLIKDISKLAKTFVCLHCQGRFTKACNLQRHSEWCSQGKAVIVCPAEQVKAPKTSFEQAFFPEHTASLRSLWWLEKEGRIRKTHIHHALCGHGGERWVEGAPVDGYDPKTKTVFQ